MNLNLLLVILVLSASIEPALSFPMDGEESLTRPLLSRDPTAGTGADRINRANSVEAQQQEAQRSDYLSVQAEEKPSTSSDSSPGTEGGTTILSITRPSSINELEEQITQVKEMVLTAAGLHGIDIANLNKLQSQSSQESEESEALPRNQEAYQRLVNLYQEALLEHSIASEKYNKALDLYYQNAASSSHNSYYQQMTTALLVHQQAYKKLYLTYELLQIKNQELQQLQAHFSSLLETNSKNSPEVTAVTIAKNKADESKLHLDVCNKKLRLLYKEREKILSENQLQQFPVPLNRQLFVSPARSSPSTARTIVPIPSRIKEITESCSPSELTETDSLSTLTTASLEDTDVSQSHITANDAEHLLAEILTAAERESELIDEENGTSERKLTAQELQRQKQLEALEIVVVALKEKESTSSFYIPSTAAFESQDNISSDKLSQSVYQEPLISSAVNSDLNRPDSLKSKKKKKKISTSLSVNSITAPSDLKDGTEIKSAIEDSTPPKSICEKARSWIAQQIESFKDSFQYTRDFLDAQNNAIETTRSYYEAQHRIPAEVPLKEYALKNAEFATRFHQEKIKQREQQKAPQEIQKQPEPQDLTTEPEVSIEPEISPFASEGIIAWASRLFWNGRTEIAKIKAEASTFDERSLKSLQWLIPSYHASLRQIIYHPELMKKSSFGNALVSNHQLMAKLNQSMEQKKLLNSQIPPTDTEIARRRREIVLQVAEAKTRQEAEIEAKVKEDAARKAAQDLLEQEDREKQSHQAVLRNRRKKNL